MADSSVDRDASAEASGGGFPYLGMLWVLFPGILIIAGSILYRAGGEVCEHPGRTQVGAVLFIIASVLLISRAITQRARTEISNIGFAFTMFLGVLSLAAAGFVFYVNGAWC